MCATIAAMAVQITKTQIAIAIAAEITDIVSNFAFMNSSSARFVAALATLPRLRQIRADDAKLAELLSHQPARRPRLKRLRNIEL